MGKLSLSAKALLAAAATIGLTLTLAPQASLRAQEPPQRSVFVIAVMARVFQGPYRGGYQSVGRGTAFFISSDGTALTSSHVVYPARTDRTYKLLAIVGKEFYGATLICASELPYDPTKTNPNVSFSRDVAEIRLTPPDFPFAELTYNVDVPYAWAHRGPLPAFPALTLEAAPHEGDSVRVLGYGTLKGAPVPYEWSAEGTVSHTMEFTDGTRGFQITFARAAVAGHSGSPVLNTVDQVVGIWNWFSRQNPQIGTAISSASLEPACP